jgi:uncharacterized iron-regulated membrane protein
MPRLHDLLHHPRRLWLRRALYQIHLWGGVFAALYILLIGLSGSALVFRDEIEHALEKPLLDPASVSGPTVDILSVAERLRAAYPNYPLAGVMNPLPPHHPTVRGYLRDGERYIAIDVHPFTGQILGRVADGGFLPWLQDLHFNLLSGPTGRFLNGIGAACLLAMCLTGLVIWWPGISHWRRSLTIQPARQWKRLNWDLHSAAGFWSAAFLATWALSGIYFAWPGPFRDAVNRLSPVALANLPVPQHRPDAPGRSADPALMLREALQRSPGARLLSISFPANDQGYFRVFLARQHPPSYESADYHYFDPSTGRHLAVWHRGGDESAGDAFLSWLGPLHFGTFGGEGAPGIAVKLLWTLLGLAPPLLAVTGLLMYWNRYLGKKWHAARRPSHPLATAAGPLIRTAPSTRSAGTSALPTPRNSPGSP